MSFGNYYHNANANNRIKGKRKQTKNSDVVGGGGLLLHIPPPEALSQRIAAVPLMLWLICGAHFCTTLPNGHHRNSVNG